MRIAYIELHPPGGPPLDWLRAVAGCAPNCVGVPDGIPETWGGPVSLVSQWDAGGAIVDMDGNTMGHVWGARTQFTTPPRYDAEYWEALAVMDADYGIDPAEYGAGSAAPDGEAPETGALTAVGYVGGVRVTAAEGE